MPRKIICTVPEQVCSKDCILELEEALSASYIEALGATASPTILWCPLPAGQSYVAGSEDDVYIFLVEVQDGLEQSQREVVMMNIAKCASQSFGIDIGKPLVSALDSSMVKEYLKGNRNRLKWHRRPGFLLGTLWHAIISKKQNGFSTMRANL